MSSLLVRYDARRRAMRFEIELADDEAARLDDPEAIVSSLTSRRPLSQKLTTLALAVRAIELGSDGT